MPACYACIKNGGKNLPTSSIFPNLSKNFEKIMQCQMNLFSKILYQNISLVSGKFVLFVKFKTGKIV